MNPDYEPQTWMKRTLLAAGIYNLLWGALCVVSPTTLLSLVGISSTPVVNSLWQCIGMITGVYGIGYLLAASDPYRQWIITLVGFLGKVLGPIGFLIAALRGDLPSQTGWIILTNDLIWWIPFVGILWGALRFHQTAGSAYEMPESDDPLRDIKSSSGMSLDELADEAPQLVLFLRHSGCTFCREALSDVAAERKRIEESGTGIVLVHLGEATEKSEQFFERYQLHDLPRFSDPACRLYRQFGLDLGGFSQLFGLRVWIRGLLAGLIRGHGIGAVAGNSFQMPGVYLYHKRQILGGFRHDYASDRPNYLDLARTIESTRQAALVS